MSPTHILGISIVGSQKGLIGVTPTFFRLEVPNLQVLQIGNLQDMPTNSIMPFHNIDPILVHCLYRDQQNWARGVNLSTGVMPLKVRLFNFLKHRTRDTYTPAANL